MKEKPIVTFQCNPGKAAVIKNKTSEKVKIKCSFCRKDGDPAILVCSTCFLGIHAKCYGVTDAVFSEGWRCD